MPKEKLAPVPATATVLGTDKVGSTGSENPAPGASAAPVRATIYEANKTRDEQIAANLNAEKKIYVDNETGEVLADPSQATHGAQQLVGADAERYEASRKASTKAEDKSDTARNKARTKGEDK